ncbi:MAG: hypothetical protein IIY77_00880 [Lachnospiraceae bacterium]|nr:hypothetical protein [Lachnospiraceae bacterium]
MYEINFTLAGIPVTACCRYEETRTFLKDYLTSDPGVFTVEISEEDITAEQDRSDKEALLEGEEPQIFSLPYLETLALYRKLASRLPEYDTILFHGSVIAMDNEGYLFTAKSGTGKSTHTALWRQVFRDRVIMINDDKPLIRISDREVRVYGTPWDGKHHLSTNTSVRLKAICLLERGQENHIEPVDPFRLYPMLLQQLFRPDDETAMKKVLELLDRLMGQISFYRLKCNMESEAAITAWKGMNHE